MQLAIAIICIIILMNMWLDNVRKDERVLAQHFDKIGEKYLQQAAIGVRSMQSKNDKAALVQYLEQLATEDEVDSIQVYGATGEKLAESGNASLMPTAYDVKHQPFNEATVPFVKALSDEKGSGFIRIDLVKSEMIDALAKENSDQQQLTRLMLLIAGITGFFITRGLSRFSRQGFRVEQKQSNH